MRKYFLIYIAFGLILLSTSCEDSAFLAEPPYSFTSPENFYQTENDLRIALIGCYSTINAKSVHGSWVPDGTFDRGLLYILGGGNDELLPYTTNELADFGRLSYLPANKSLSSLWTAYYAGISSCNLLLEKAEGVEMNASTKEKIIAETRFLRAFFYYHLGICFGGVPVITSSVPDSEAGRDNLESVFALILDDLEYAYHTLDDISIFQGGATKWAAGGYLGVVCNYLASCKRYNVGESLDFELNSFAWVNADEMSEKAVTVLQDVVKNSGYTLVDGEKYSHLFRETTKSEQYKECLFMAEKSDVMGTAYTEKVNFPIPNGNMSLYGGGYGRLRPTQKLYFSYEDTDIRKEHNITGILNEQSTVELIDGARYYVPLAPSLVSRINWCTGKFRMQDPNEKSLPNNATSLSYPLLRFADVLLQYAEALYFTGDESEARGYFTVVRKRVTKSGTDVSILNDAYYKADFLEELLDERSRELCFETKRRIDLIRFDKLEEAIFSLDLTSENFATEATEMQRNYEYFKIWFPIPITEIDLNGNLIPNPQY